MIETIKDEEGKVVAYATWFALTKYQQFDPEHTDKEKCLAYIDKFWRRNSARRLLDCGH